MKNNIYFLEETINVYRTEQYIVVQQVGMKLDDYEDNVIFSYDIYYLRNKKRDKEYERIYQNRRNINGKRIKTTMYLRKYM